MTHRVIEKVSDTYFLATTSNYSLSLLNQGGGKGAVNTLLKINGSMYY